MKNKLVMPIVASIVALGVYEYLVKPQLAKVL